MGKMFFHGTRDYRPLKELVITIMYYYSNSHRTSSGGFSPPSLPFPWPLLFLLLSAERRHPVASIFAGRLAPDLCAGMHPEKRRRRDVLPRAFATRVIWSSPTPEQLVAERLPLFFFFFFFFSFS
jgi:hypothetical protein